jgi:hypothetical protein
MSDGALMSDDLGMPLLAANLLTKVDIAAKRYKKHKNKISGLVISMGYKE